LVQLIILRSLISRKQTFYPIKSYKKIIYDSLSRTHKSKITSLFLVDDFNRVIAKKSLLLISKGTFGYQNKSHINTSEFISEVNYHRSSLKRNNSYPLADRKWYEKWIQNAPKGYWNLRIQYHNSGYDKQYQNYKQYSERSKNGN
jgi:hypothetical protein